MLGKIKGWNFKKAFSADGSNTLNTLNADKKKLEARLLAIPTLIAQLRDSIMRAKNDVIWLEGLSNRKRKKWEKEKGTTVETAVYNYQKGIVTSTGRITSMTAEQKLIPSKIKAIQTQLDTLVKGESVGLEKGLDAESAKALGEIELQKEKERLVYERAIREAELKAETQKLELQAEKDRQEFEVKTKANEKAGTDQNKLFIGIGITLLLIIGGFILYKRKIAKQAG
jgi:LPXTG-motif cell wall-anchored protein